MNVGYFWGLFGDYLRRFDYELTIGECEQMFSFDRQTHRNSRKGKGSVGVESVEGRLRIHLPRYLFGGKAKILDALSGRYRYQSEGG